MDARWRRTTTARETRRWRLRHVTVYSSQLQVAGTEMRSTWLVARRYRSASLFDNLFGVQLTNVTSEILLRVMLPRYTSTASAHLDPGSPGIGYAHCYYTAAQIGEVHGPCRVAPGIPDSSAFIARTVRTSSRRPRSDRSPQLRSGFSHRRRQNVFPLTVKVAHPDTGALAARSESMALP